MVHDVHAGTGVTIFPKGYLWGDRAINPKDIILWHGGGGAKYPRISCMDGGAEKRGCQNYCEAGVGHSVKW